MAFIQASFLQMRDENGKDLGSMATGQAKEYARKRGLELVAVDETVNPPIYTVKARQRFVPKNPMDEAMAQ
jgi:translation initiation factor IF-3